MSSFTAHLAPHLELREVVGIDLFHSRFAPEPCWNRSSEKRDFWHRLTGLERRCGSNPALIGHAAHILLAGVPVSDRVRSDR
jgi:hypothetical protein